MQIYINGQEQVWSEGGTLAVLVDKFDLNIRKIAIELNLAIVPRSLYDETILCDGDKIEIVQFIGGG